MLGALPPSSSVTRLRLPEENLQDLLANCGGPREGHFVDVRVQRKSGARSGPRSRAATLITPGGSPVSWISSASRSEDRHANSAGLSTRVLPQASAVAILIEAMESGTFHGMIWPHTPIGSSNMYMKPLESVGLVEPRFSTAIRRSNGRPLQPRQRQLPSTRVACRCPMYRLLQVPRHDDRWPRQSSAAPGCVRAG